MLHCSVKIDLSRWIKYKDRIEKGLKEKVGPVGDCILKQWPKRYMAAMKKRFVEMSRGGWAPLAESTLRARMRKVKGVSRTRAVKINGARQIVAGNRKRTFMPGGISVSILRDTGLLFNTLDPAISEAAGRVSRGIPFGIEVGIGGPDVHEGGPATIGEIAYYHQHGSTKTHLPKREILVETPPDVQASMTGDMDRACRVAAREAGFE